MSYSNELLYECSLKNYLYRLVKALFSLLEELQKVLFEQIDLRRRLEQEFQVLKGNASFPVFSKTLICGFGVIRGLLVVVGLLKVGEVCSQLCCQDFWLSSAEVNGTSAVAFQATKAGLL